MQTGENEQGLRKIVDLTRWISIALLLLHFYYQCYGAFRHWNIQSSITDSLLRNVERTGLFSAFVKAKLFALLFLSISTIGARGKKDERTTIKSVLLYIGTGLLLYLTSGWVLQLSTNMNTKVLLYMSVTVIGFVLVLTGGTIFSRIIQQRLSPNVFNSVNETFPQEERMLQNEYSINLPARYNLKGKMRRSWINIINPFRGLLVMGTPGSGKSYFIIRHIIHQHLQKGFALFVYDFKNPDLTTITYNHFLAYKNRYRATPSFYTINFDDLSRSHRCNPLAPETLLDITDAAESSRTIMLGLNREWIRKGGDFFVESPINFVTALIWFLRKFKGGEFCTLPHVIELAQVGYDKLFSILRAEPEIELLINPFVSAYLNGAMEQLEGQIASAKISLSRLASPSLYWVLSGDDFTLDINNPNAPKIVSMGSNPQKTATYGAVVSLYTTAMTRMVNRKGGLKCSLIFDEFPTLYFNGIDSLIATARSNRVATTLAVQDSSQLRMHYGKEQADVILNIVGNIISGQVSGETAKQLSEKFGKILQDRQSLSLNQNGTSITNSKQLEMAIPASKIASLSSGEFVGSVADNPDEKISLKVFCCEIINHHDVLAKESLAFQPLPVVTEVTAALISEKYGQIKKDIVSLVLTEIERMMDTPELSEKIVKKND
jgi:hypothetical protein